MFGLSGLKLAGVGGILGAIIAAALMAWLVVPQAYSRGYTEAAAKADVVIKKKNADAIVLNGRFDQCQGANRSYQEDVVAQLGQVKAEIAAQQQRDAGAGQKNEAADKRLVDGRTEAAQNAERVRELIRNAVQECVRTRASADYVGMLNSVLPGGRPAAGPGPDGAAGAQAHN